ncbi:MAG: folate-binding protein YgfZ [Pusillimonas sp.]|nr:folate-binding protein YgfZ [Pusillimonas sp.]
MNLAVNSATVLSDLAILEFAGVDTPTFLQGQLSNDVMSITSQKGMLAAYCNPKGRTLATLVLWKASDTPDNEPVYQALVKSDIADALVKRLTMFVLRSKVRIRRLSASAIGLKLENSQAAANAVVPEVNGLNMAALPNQAKAYDVISHPGGISVAAPESRPDTQRWWFIPNEAQTLTLEANASALSQWQTADICAGLPWVEHATQEAFIPQTLNLDLINGVSFTKGCYPGQEVVARSHYRGTVKRRMARGTAHVPAENVASLPGQDLFNLASAHPDAPAGRVVNAAHDGAQVQLLLEVKLADMAQATYRLGQPDGPTVTLANLPYDIEADAG